MLLCDLSLFEVTFVFFCLSLFPLLFSVWTFSRLSCSCSFSFLLITTMTAVVVHNLIPMCDNWYCWYYNNNKTECEPKTLEASCRAVSEFSATNASSAPCLRLVVFWLFFLIEKTNGLVVRVIMLHLVDNDIERSVRERHRPHIHLQPLHISCKFSATHWERRTPQRLYL